MINFLQTEFALLPVNPHRSKRGQVVVDDPALPKEAVCKLLERTYGNGEREPVSDKAARDCTRHDPWAHAVGEANVALDAVEAPISLMPGNEGNLGFIVLDLVFAQALEGLVERERDVRALGLFWRS